MAAVLPPEGKIVALNRKIHILSETAAILSQITKVSEKMAAILHRETEIVAINHKNAHLCRNGGHFVSNYLNYGIKTP